METKPTTQLIVTLIGLPILIISLVLGVFLLAGRGLSEPMGYLSAASDETADRLTESLPQEVRDKKLDRDLEAIRQNLIDRKVQLQLSQRRIAELERDVAELTKRVDRRKRLLGEAYPILQKAVEQDAQTVRFASESFTLDEFQREIDELLVAQEADEQRLSVKRDGLQRLKGHAQEGRVALAQMQRKLEQAEQEVEILKTRREQAQVEAQTLEMVEAVTDGGGALSGGEITRSLSDLREGVDELEARNEARRSVSPESGTSHTNRLDRQWQRLEALEQYRQQEPAEPDTPATQPAEAP